VLCRANPTQRFRASRDVNNGSPGVLKRSLDRGCCSAGSAESLNTVERSVDLGFTLPQLGNVLGRQTFAPGERRVRLRPEASGFHVLNGRVHGAKSIGRGSHPFETVISVGIIEIVAE
jgi:hypothetical protein